MPMKRSRGQGQNMYLPHAHSVDPPSDLLDENRRQPLRPELLVHAQEVDLHRLDGRIHHPHPGGVGNPGGGEGV